MKTFFKTLRILVPTALVAVCFWAIFYPNKATIKGVNLTSNLYEVKASYPVFDGPQGRVIENFVSEQIRDFLGRVAELKPEDIRIMELGTDPERRWILNIETEIATSTKFTSYILKKYAYYGGAHGNTEFYTYVYSRKAEKFVGLANVISGSDYIKTDYIKRISQAARDQLYTRLRDTGLSTLDMIDEGTAIDPDNFKTFYPTDTGIVFVFSPYAVGPYAIGPQKVEIPFEVLR